MTSYTLSRRRFLVTSAGFGLVGAAGMGRGAAGAAQGIDPALMAEVRELYALPSGQEVRCVRPPFPAARQRFYEAANPEQARLIPAGPQTMYLRWEGDRLQLWGQSFGGPGPTFGSLMETMAHVYPQEVEGDAELLKKSFAGDYIYRAGAKPEAVAAGLAGIFRAQFQVPVRAAFRMVERPVTVARGRFAFKPLPDRQQIEIYGRELADPNRGGGGSGTVGECLAWVGMFIDRRIVDETQDPPAADVSWHYNERLTSNRERAEDRNPGGVLRHFTEQTGITFVEEKRMVRVLFLERGA
jgi:hypothetical protein